MVSSTLPGPTRNKMKKFKNLYNIKMDKIGHTSVLIEIRAIANGFGEEKSDLERIQSIVNISAGWNKDFLDCLSIKFKNK